MVEPPGDPGGLPGAPPVGHLGEHLVILPEVGLDEDPVPPAVRGSVVCQREPAADSGWTH